MILVASLCMSLTPYSMDPSGKSSLSNGRIHRHLLVFIGYTFMTRTTHAYSLYVLMVVVPFSRRFYPK